MATYLYGLILAHNAARVPRAGVGINGSPLRVLPCDGFAALVSTLDEGVPKRPSVDHIQAHDAGLQSAVDAGVTVAAARFGQTFVDDSDACRQLAERSPRIAALLAACDGCVEMRLLLSSNDLERASMPAVSEAGGEGRAIGPGHAYLESLRPRDEGALRLDGPLRTVVRAERISRLPAASVAVAHLIHRDAVASYRANVARIPALAKAKIVGPLALYSFAEAEE